MAHECRAYRHSRSFHHPQRRPGACAGARRRADPPWIPSDCFCPRPYRLWIFRDTLCATSCVAATPAGNSRQATVETWIDDYIRHFEHDENRQFDIWHAQSESSGNALATLKERGLIGGFGFTVHHILGDEPLRRLQLRAITSADHLFVVGRVWQDWVARELKRDACYVGNGVDRTRFSPRPDETDSELQTLLHLPVGVPLFLALGGIEWRKNTISGSASLQICASAAPFGQAGDRRRRRRRRE